MCAVVFLRVEVCLVDVEVFVEQVGDSIVLELQVVKDSFTGSGDCRLLSRVRVSGELRIRKRPA